MRSLFKETTKHITWTEEWRNMVEDAKKAAELKVQKDSSDRISVIASHPLPVTEHYKLMEKLFVEGALKVPYYVLSGGDVINAIYAASPSASVLTSQVCKDSITETLAQRYRDDIDEQLRRETIYSRSQETQALAQSFNSELSKMLGVSIDITGGDVNALSRHFKDPDKAMSLLFVSWNSLMGQPIDAPKN